MKTRLDNWRDRRRLKKLWIDPRELEPSLNWQTRRQHDAMPNLVLMPKPVLFAAERWIMGHRDLPVVQGRIKGGV